MMKCKYEHDGDCCYSCADQYMCKCKQPCEFLYPVTNADCIRAMTDEELAKMLISVYIQDYFGHPNDIRDWLQQPCGGADHE